MQVQHTQLLCIRDRRCRLIDRRDLCFSDRLKKDPLCSEEHLPVVVIERNLIQKINRLYINI